ncbi:MAG: penicillin acylase family protein, partial [Gemmatimonadales bacterium]|nr:penicillin acylase family protein [Gemmatimonadales bacterium]
WAVLDGASGEADSPNRFDQNPIWARGEMVPMRYDWTEIARHASSTQTLRP